MKKYITIILAAVIVWSFTSCGSWSVEVKEPESGAESDAQTGAQNAADPASGAQSESAPQTESTPQTESVTSSEADPPEVRLDEKLTGTWEYFDYYSANSEAVWIYAGEDELSYFEAVKEKVAAGDVVELTLFSEPNDYAKNKYELDSETLQRLLTDVASIAQQTLSPQSANNNPQCGGALALKLVFADGSYVILDMGEENMSMSSSGTSDRYIYSMADPAPAKDISDISYAATYLKEGIKP